MEEVDGVPVMDIVADKKWLPFCGVDKIASVQSCLVVLRSLRDEQVKQLATEFLSAADPMGTYDPLPRDWRKKVAEMGGWPPYMQLECPELGGGGNGVVKAITMKVAAELTQKNPVKIAVFPESLTYLRDAVRLFEKGVVSEDEVCPAQKKPRIEFEQISPKVVKLDHNRKSLYVWWKADAGAWRRHYQKPSEWTQDAIAETEKALIQWLAQNHRGGARTACARASCARDATRRQRSEARTRG